MNRYSKRINPGLRPQIEAVKGYIRDARRPFDGEGYVFQTALRECRKEGLMILYDRKHCHYTKIERNP